MMKEPRTPSSGAEKEVGDNIQAGHVEELRRDFSVWSRGSLYLCLMATWEVLSSVVAAALANGGTPCLFYN